MGIETNLDTPLAIAVRKAGSQSAFGRLVGRRQSTVNDWLRLRRPLPAEYVLKVEAELGISRHVLRPDVYPLEHSAVVSIQDIGSEPNGSPIKSRFAASNPCQNDTKEVLAA